MVKAWFHETRSHRTAICEQIGQHADAVEQRVARKTLALGLQHFGGGDLQALKATRKQLRTRVLDLAKIAHHVAPEFALDTTESIGVLGALHASPAAKAALKNRSRKNP